MNIIKFQDKIMPAEMPMAEYFNKYLKGKYAYWVQMRYVVSFDHMRHEGYVACEEDITKLLQKEDGTYPRPYGAPSLDIYMDGVIHYVDSIETDRINNTVDFRMKNKYVADEDITIDELKVFRTWLATEILKMDQTELGEQKNSILNELDTHVLEYYKNGMYDNTIRVLSDFGTSLPPLEKVTTNTCGCHNNSSLNALYMDINNPCDPIAIYKQNIYNKMVVMFSKLEFWTQWSPEFLGVFKKYIDNIINLNLPLTPNNMISNFTDCGCNNENEDNNIDILKRLSVSLGYMINDDIVGHKNYIYDALSNWSSMLYENMYWS